MKYKIICLENNELSMKYANECIEQAKKFDIHLEKHFGVHADNVMKHIEETKIIPRWNFKGLRKGVLGCFFSHYYLWKECIENNEPYLILEHDGYFIRKLPDNVLDTFTDVLKLDNLDPFSKTYNLDIENEKNNNNKVIEYMNLSLKNQSYNNTGMYLKGAYSYIIKPQAAKKVIDWININGFLPTDVQLGKAIVDLKVCTPTVARLHPDYFNSVEDLSLTRTLKGKNVEVKVKYELKKKVKKK